VYDCSEASNDVPEYLSQQRTDLDTNIDLLLFIIIGAAIMDNKSNPSNFAFLSQILRFFKCFNKL